MEKQEIARLNLYIMGKKGLLVLKELLHEFPHLVNMVISAQDESVTEDFYQDIKELCLNHGVLFYNKFDEFLDDAPFTIAISWRWIINKKKGQLIVLHDSLLPKYRGFNPLVSCLLNKEEEIGVSAIFPTENYDEGDIITQAKRKVEYPIKIIDAINLVSECYIEVAMYISRKIYCYEQLTAYKQNEQEVTYSLWRDELDYIIDWSKSSDYIKTFVDSSGYPYKYACTSINGVNLRVKDVEIVEEVFIENRQPGKIIFLKNGFPTVVCGSGLIKIISAFYEDQEMNFLPFNKFRTRFGF